MILDGYDYIVQLGFWNLILDTNKKSTSRIRLYYSNSRKLNYTKPIEQSTYNHQFKQTHT